METKSAKKIPHAFNLYKEIEFTANGKISWFRILRIRVEIDIRKPLFTGFNRNKDPLRISWVHLQYERLPDFYFCCGRLGHVDRICPFPPLEQPTEMGSPYGP
ncbi:hypothetical protein RJ639_022737 [Escallonia herrerae]|uniref:Zinc knuckle CX2CX4HX4C domain-containing protein n=1 Tax=Escallonia herrerae TaxID=1293975 RepID=A0AA88V219_9ASTE|nr:hypothetical protein RJ639_022737 [Escallonia herrerae]